MTKILAAPEFAHGKGFFTDAGEVARSVWAVGRRLYPYSVTCEDVQEVMQHLLSRGVPKKTARYAIKIAKRKDPECSDPIYIIIGWRQERLDALNQVWGAPDPAAFVRDALIASGMTETESPHVLWVTDENLPSTRNNFVEGLAGFRPMMLACGMSEAGAKVFAQPARLPVLDACVLLANGDHPRPLLHQDLMLWIG